MLPPDGGFLPSKLTRRLFSSFTVFGYLYYSAEQVFDKASVTLDVFGPDRVSSGDKTSFTVTFRNNTETTLQNAEVVFTWPKQSILSDDGQRTSLRARADFGVIVPYQDKSVTFEGRIYGFQGQEKEISVLFRYTPQDYTAVFEETKNIPIHITSTPFALSMRLPAQVVPDKELEAVLEYQNQSDAYFPDTKIVMSYPSGFRFLSAEPSPTKGDNIWELGTVEGRAEGIITLTGSFSGAQGESQSIYVELGSEEDGEFVPYTNTDSSITIASSALIVFQTVNDARELSANPGSALQYRIRYKNTTNVQIPNAVILAQLDDTYVDLKTLNIQWGSFDGRTNAIIWNTVGVPELAVLDPKEEGEVSFTVTVKPVFLPKSFADKNPIIISKATITSSSPPEGVLHGLPIESEDTVAVKINTQFSFNENAYYAGGLIQNAGPLPPKVGQRTAFAVSWQLTNTINDVEDVVVKAVMPPNVAWTGVVYPKDADITYNPDTGIIAWNPKTVFAGTGILVPLKRVDFQVAFTPALVHVGQAVNLVSEASLTGSDAFTGLEIRRTVPQVNSDLLGTLRDEGRVIQ